MSVEGTREIMMRYFDTEHADTSMLADDVVFTIMTSGEEYCTPRSVLEMLNYFYNVAFDAVPVTKNIIFADSQAVFEGVFVGKHIGEFAGIPATQKDVRVPLTVIYDLENGQIKHGRIYFLMASLMAQLGV